MSTYPSVIASLTNPQATDRLNSPSHSGVEQAQNTNITAIQNFLGVEGASSTLGTLIYDARSPGSGGGGHIQTAVLGGTGQSTFTKGDIFVATNSSTISKLAVGTDTQIIQANSSTASGVNWVNSNSNKLYVNASVFTIASVAVSEGSLFSMTLPASTLGTSNAVRTKNYIRNWTTDANCSVLTAFQYGGQNVASIMTMVLNTGGNFAAEINHTMMANNLSNSQSHLMYIDFIMASPNNSASLGGNVSFNTQNYTTPSVMVFFKTQVLSTSSVNSSANQTYGATMRILSGNGTSIMTGGTIVEKIS